VLRGCSERGGQTGSTGGLFIPGVEGAVARIGDVVETITEIDDIFVSTAALDDGMVKSSASQRASAEVTVIVSTSSLETHASS
jgi:hypothetical protein